MARTVRDAQLDTRTARSRLKARKKPYYRVLDLGLHLGYRKSTGRWVVRWYVGNQDYLTETLAGVSDDKADADGLTVLSFAQAQAKARALYAERERAAQGVVAAGPYTVHQCIEDYLTIDRRSGRDARWRAEALILPQLGDIECARLTPKELRKWLTHVAATPPRLRVKKGANKPRFRELEKGDADAKRRRQASANRVLTILKAALNLAWREGKIGSDDAWRRVKPFEATDSARVRYLSVSEAKRLVNACAPDFRWLVQAALETGARYGELAALRVADFNADSGTIHIRTSKSGKGRHVVLADDGIALFRMLVAGKTGDALILTKADGSAWERSHQGRPMRAACARAKIEPAFSFHGIRHSWASLATMGGIPLLVIAKNLGHADTRMVERHYGHLAPSYVADAIRAGAPRFGLTLPRKVVPIT